MDDGVVADRDIVADDAGIPAVDMEQREILDICALADPDRRDVAPQNSIEPDTAAGADLTSPTITAPGAMKTSSAIFGQMPLTSRMCAPGNRSLMQPEPR